MLGIKRKVYTFLVHWKSAQGELQGDSRIHDVRIRGVRLRVADAPNSVAAVHVANELNRDCYRVDDIAFEEGDVVIDIGAHVGVFDAYLAKRYRFVRILAFEPTPVNYRHLVYNIAANKVTSVQTFNQAVTGDGRTLAMTVHDDNTGGATACIRNLHLPDHEVFTVASRTLDSIFDEFQIAKCKLLKINCEGSEHEILPGSRCLSRVKNLRGEFHINANLTAQGYSVDALIEHCCRHVPRQNVHVESIRMAE